MKKTIILILIFSFTFFISCSKDSKNVKSMADSKQDISTLGLWGNVVKEHFDGQEITVAMATHPSTTALQKLVEDFTALTGIKVVWDIVEETNLKTKQLLDSQGNGNFDALMVDAFWMNEYVSKNVLEELDSYISNSSLTPKWYDYEDIVPAYRNGIASANGEHYAIPIAGETRFVGYRTDLFEKYNKTPPKTLSEFLELAKFFNGKEKNLYGVAMRGQRGIHFASGWMSLMYNFGAGFVDQSSLGTDKIIVTVDTPETKESLQYYIDLLKNAPKDVGTYTHEEALGAFVSGKTAMWLDATALANEITNPKVSTVSDKVSFVPTPGGPGGDGAALAGWSLGISSKSKKSELAWAFIMYMTSKEASTKYINSGGIATRFSQFENSDFEAKFPSFKAQGEALKVANKLVEKNLSWVPQMKEINQVLEIAGAYGSSALAGDISVDEAISKTQEDLEKLLK